MDTFRFTISLAPPDAEYLTLLREIATQMSRLAGLGEKDSRQAVDELGEAVRERLREAPQGGGPVLIAFERTASGAPVTIDITSSGRRVADSRRRLTWGGARRD